MAKNPFRFWPFLIISSASLKIYEPVEIGLKVIDIHADKSPYVSFKPAVHVVDKSHVLEIFRILAVRLVDFGCTVSLSDHCGSDRHHG